MQLPQKNGAKAMEPDTPAKTQCSWQVKWHREAPGKMLMQHENEASNISSPPLVKQQLLPGHGERLLRETEAQPGERTGAQHRSYTTHKISGGQQSV